MTGGGAATNAGIDFQSRVAALGLLALVTDEDVLGWIWSGAGGASVRELRFETADAVDDLVITTDGPTVYVQVKRAPNFSALSTSEFVAALSQFVQQFAAAPDADQVFVLATSLDASAPIKRDLRKLTEAARLNELGADANPLTRAETDVLEKTYALIDSLFAEHAGRAIEGDERDALFKRIHVAPLDIESGGNLEKAALTVIASQSSLAPEAVFSALIALALALARERLSVDRDGARARVGNLFTARADGAEVSVADATKVVLGDPISAGREVVLVEDDEENLFIFELIRFDDDGSRRVRFADGHLEFPDGPRVRVLYRAATYEGITRLILADTTVTEGREVVIVPINGEAEWDSSPWPQAHAELCAARIREGAAALECIECGRPIAEPAPHAAEIDEEGLPHDAGLVHVGCLRPTHRVVGRVAIDSFGKHQLPPDFDHRTWVATRPHGQAAFNEMNPALQAQIVQIGWKPARPGRAGNWGVRYTLEDGDTRWVRERARVTRQSKAESEADAEMMNETLARAAAEGDPFCVSEHGAFGPYSLLLRADPGVNLRQVVSAEPAPLTRATLAAQDDADNFYAPLISLLNAETGQPFMLAEARVLLTDPLTVGERVENWERAGFEVPPLHTSVIATDEEFDTFVVNAFRAGDGVVIDPLLRPAGDAVAGFVVRDLEADFGRRTAERGDRRRDVAP